ncbi:MAG: hypothetical protein EOO77_31275 [Oxalobacteraceae bacterium]|nr:MAG: hypothetical protein EOO77_31275 [Oxalobacteraceae bacterium]
MSPKILGRSIASAAPRMLGWATTMLAAFAVSGCAAINTVPPTVSVIDVQLTGLGLLDQQLATTLCVTNPNPTALSFRRVNVAVEVSGLPLAEGISDHAVFLPPNASTVVPFSVASNARNLGAQLLGTVSNGSLNYRVHGSIALDGPIGVTVPFSRSGRVDPLAGGFALLHAVTDPTVGACTRLSR